jgi:hypothetical protein
VRSEQEPEVLREGAMEINPDELREFLEADLLGSQADPEFKDALRRKLWTLVRAKYGKPPGSRDPEA